MGSRLLGRAGIAAAVAAAAIATSLFVAPASAKTTCYSLGGGMSLCFRSAQAPHSRVEASIRSDRTGNVLTAFVTQSTSPGQGDNSVLVEASDNTVVGLRQSQRPDTQATSFLLVSPGGIVTLVQAKGPGYCELFLGGRPTPAMSAPCPGGVAIPFVPHLLP
jgi:hypothetical protein